MMEDIGDPKEMEGYTRQLKFNQIPIGVPFIMGNKKYIKDANKNVRRLDKLSADQLDVIRTARDAEQEKLRKAEEIRSEETMKNRELASMLGALEELGAEGVVIPNV